MKKIFERERAEIIQNVKIENRYFTEEIIKPLPEPVKKYLRVCKYIDKPIMYNADVIWEESYIKLSPCKEWTMLETRQLNTMNPIARIAYMRFKKAPISCRDIYLNGHGEMKVKCLNLINIANENGNEVSQSALITIFCEFLFLPGYIFQDYVEWETIDDLSVKASLSDNGISVSGIFHFNKEGFFSHFETNDRYYSDKNVNFYKTKFSAIVDSYQINEGIFSPRNVRIIWHLKEADFEYYKGTIGKINYNVNQ